VLSSKMINVHAKVDGWRIGKGNCYCLVYLIFFSDYVSFQSCAALFETPCIDHKHTSDWSYVYFLV
jgi:hypothetical protein